MSARKLWNMFITTIKVLQGAKNLTYVRFKGLNQGLEALRNQLTFGFRNLLLHSPLLLHVEYK